MMVAAVRWRRFGSRDAVSIPLQTAIAAALGVALYLVVPAAGPVFRWVGRFPARPPTGQESPLGLSPLDVNALRNAMPSLHMAGAFFVSWNTWSLGRLARVLGTIMLILTFVATLGNGQHYLVDLVVALPFAFTVDAMTRRGVTWRIHAVVGGALTLFWVLGLRLVPAIFVMPGVTPSFSVLTIGIVCGLAWRSSNLRAVSVWDVSFEPEPASPS